MSHKLQKLLQLDEKMFDVGISRLEKTTGRSAIDIRLIAEILESAHKIMRKVGLDVKDTTKNELYHCLMSAVSHHKVEELLEKTDYTLIMIDDEIISFNMIDVIENYHHELPFDKRLISHGQRALKGEILDRYINHAKTDEITTRSIALAMGLIDSDD